MIRYSENSRLIFDLGMNNGDDTAYYLSCGFNVVALDANPALCELARNRFQTEINDGRLKIVNAAVWERMGESIFYINLDNDHWSSLDPGWAGRDASQCTEIKVRCVTLSSLFDEFGVPHYLKIDVEGVDLAVLEQMRGCDLLPRYVSVEDCRFGLQFMKILAGCGYDAFKLVDQSTVSQVKDPLTGRRFPAGSSGPFGDDISGDWIPYQRMIALYLSTVRDRDGKRLAPRTQWWDIHCTNLGKRSIE